MSLHLYLTKYKVLYGDFNNISEKIGQKIRVAIMNFRHTEVDNSLFARNLLIKQVRDNFLLIFWDDNSICAYFVNEINISRLEFPDLDYKDKLLYQEFIDIVDDFVTIPFRSKGEDFKYMVAPIVASYSFNTDALSSENTIIGEVI